MPEFLKVNGVSVPVNADSFEEEIIRIGEVTTRNLGGAAFRQESSVRYRYTFETPPMERAVARRLKTLIEGKFLTWNFAANKLSGSFVGQSGVGTHTQFATGGKFGPRLFVSTGSNYQFNPSNKLYQRAGWSVARGYTFAHQSFRTVASDGVPVNGWYDYLVKGSVSTTRGTLNPAGVKQYRDGIFNASHNTGAFNQIQSNSVAFWAYSANNAPLSVDYSDVLLLPFEAPDPGVADSVGGVLIDWIPQLTAARALRDTAPAPLVYAESPWINDGAITCFGTCHSGRQLHGRGSQFLERFSVQLDEA
jgi:hypothetical protein